MYVIVGWSASVAFPQLYNSLGAIGFALVLGGGLLYTMGAVVYALKWPDPWPRMFGYHEIFHLFTVAGAGCHLAAIALLCRAVDVDGCGSGSGRLSRRNRSILLSH